jgi:hypothetical protein
MPDRLAVKRLTASDLTFFEHLFRTLNVGNQKSINLNADVLVEQLYPTLPALSAKIGDVIPVSLLILGPGGLSAHLLARSITKREAYKNWRLNGEFVRDPEGEPGRYDNLQAGDLAVFDFQGDPVPQKVVLLLISQSAAADIPLHTALAAMIPGGRRTMVRVTRDTLANAAAAIPKAHTIWQLAADPEFEAALEDAALGGQKGTEELAKIPSKIVSSATLAAAKASAEKNGREGEALAWVYLQSLHASGAMKSIEWTSETNAVSPFDFKAVDSADVTVRIDAKSTSGDFGWPIHMSLSELRSAAAGARYDIYRLYDLDEDGALLRISSDIQSTAKEILVALKLPEGVSVDGVSIDPKILKWGENHYIERPEEDSEEDAEE